MKKGPRGGMLVLMVFLTAAFFLFGLLIANVGQAAALSERAQTLADVSVLSSVRLRVEALEKISERWWEFGRRFGPVLDDGSVYLPSAAWDGAQTDASALKKSLSGYQGRTTSVVKVVAEANGIAKDQIETVDASGSKLGLSSEKATVQNESGLIKSWTDVWLRRSWAPNDARGNPSETTRHRVRLAVPLIGGGGSWEVAREASGQMRWDVANDDASVRALGNGGYPRSWPEAVQDERLLPNRWALYRAELSR